jgi:tRNA-2-methylthio-N6-dimethylallyladenosine synthase
MGRGYTRAEYVALVEALRRARPGLALSTDVIVGFPGETEEDFAATLSLVAEARFNNVFAFQYSPRPGTAAPRLDGQVDEATSGQRLQRLFALQDGIQRELNQELVGRHCEVLVTGWGREAGVLTGRTSCHRVVNFPAGEAPPAPGTLTTVRIARAAPHSLVGEREPSAA